MAHVPDDRAVCGRMVEGAQRADEPPTEPPALLAHPLRAMGTAERSTGKIGEEAGRAFDPLIVDETDAAMAAARAHDARTWQVRILAFQMEQRRRGEVGDRWVLGRVSDLQNIIHATGGGHFEVLITLPRQPHGARFQAVA